MHRDSFVPGCAASIVVLVLAGWMFDEWRPRTPAPQSSERKLLPRVGEKEALLALAGASEPTAPVDPIPVYNVRVIDGDTIEGDVHLVYTHPEQHLPFGVSVPLTLDAVILHKQRMRVLGVDAYELGTPKGEKAKLDLSQVVTTRQVVIFPSSSVSFQEKGVQGSKDRDSFGRLLVKVSLRSANEDPIDLRTWIIKKGYNAPSKDR
jgi:endonuclease YncB( thermonuclease family)